MVHLSTADASEFDYPFSMFGWDWNRNTVVRLGASLIALLLLGLSAASGLVPATSITAHNILHHLNFLPLMMAGMIFGWRGASWASLFAFAVNLPIPA